MKPDVEETAPPPNHRSHVPIGHYHRHSLVTFSPLVGAERKRDLINSVMSWGGNERQKKPCSVHTLCRYHETIINTLLFPGNLLRTPTIE